MPSIPLPFSSQPISEWIVQLQQSNSAEERLRALQAIGLLAPQMEIVRWATHALVDSDSTVRALAAKHLGKLEHPLSVEAENQLAPLLDDTDPDVRFEVARALVLRRSPQAGRAVPILFAFLDESETHALMVAAVVNTLIENNLDQRVVDDELQPRIRPLLDHDRAEVREAVATAFAKWPSMSVSCIDQLLPRLDDSEPIVREKIAEALGQARVTSVEVLAALQSAAQDEDTEVARAATNALHRLTSL